MSLPQKRLSKKISTSLVLREDQQSFRAVKLARQNSSTQIKCDGKQTGKRAFFEDFTLEHCLSGPQVTSREFLGPF
jgi:hypothetical protein